jgi:hypothetical protein
MKKLNARGFSHEFLLVAFVVIFAVIGVGYLVASRADTSTAPELNSNAKNFKSQGVTPLHSNERPIQFYAKGGKKGSGSGGGGSTTTSYGSGNLTYNGGFVLHSPTVRAIYWVPAGYSVSSGYASTIDGFLKNVAGSKGRTDNVFYSDTQYTDSNGAANPYFTFGGSVVDTNPFPANGCTVSYSAICINDSQVETELKNVAAAQGWPTGGEQVYAFMLPKGVGECTTATGYCAFVGACAWHHDHGYVLPTAYVPYAAFSSGCASGQSPNHDDADSTINTLSHELSELITDAPQSSWYDTAGYENGDKCAWLFGTVLGGNTGSLYNQVIGTGQYFIQSEFSNQSGKCVTSGL